MKLSGSGAVRIGMGGVGRWGIRMAMGVWRLLVRHVGAFVQREAGERGEECRVQVGLGSEKLGKGDLHLACLLLLIHSSPLLSLRRTAWLFSHHWSTMYPLPPADIHPPCIT